MEKATYQAPQGLADMPDAEAPALEIELETDEPMDEETAPTAIGHDDNLVEVLDEATLVRLRADVMDDIRNDLNGRKDWEETLTEGISLLGMRYEKMSE